MLEAFMWGYWGWGGSTRELVEAFDAAEAQHGYEPPVFVDVRIRREVRAVGFRGNAFEKLLGGDRHVRMRGLGNKAVLEGGPMDLLDPRVVDDLLDLIVKNDRARRRVIFFCACEMPRNAGERWCHRDLIAELLVKMARRRQVALSVVEWPGGAPQRMITRFSRAAAKAGLSDKAKSLPMPMEISLAVGVSLPWGSYALVDGPDGLVPLVLGPAIHRQGGWSLQRRWPTLDGSSEAQWQRHILAYRKAWGYEPRLSPESARPAAPLWEGVLFEGSPGARKARV
jgi:hypothetical protein